MKWILLPLLWLFALGLALFVLWRMARGKNVVLRGRYGPQLVRMVVIILVTFGIGIERSSAAAPRPDKTPPQVVPVELPAAINQDIVGKWLAVQHSSSRWSRFKVYVLQLQQSPATAVNAAALQHMTEVLPSKFRALVTADLTAQGNPAPRPRPEDLLEALTELEAAGYYDHFLAAYLFRLTSAAPPVDAKPFVTLYARLADHVRLTNTLVRAQAVVKPPMMRPRAWMSKALSPVRDLTPLNFLSPQVSEMVGACKALHASSTLGTWEKDGVVVATIGKQSPPLTMLRSGATVFAGQPLRLSRLDLIQTPTGQPVVITNDWLGELRLPAGRVISIWELPRHLSAEARTRIGATISEALSGSEAAAERLEVHLPFAQSALREALKKQPQEKGSPRLRLILSLFDDSVMPQVTSPISSREFPDEPTY